MVLVDSNGNATCGNHDADSATGTGERHSRPARRADTGHWSATESGTLEMHWALECHRFRDTGLALESSASRRLDTGRKRALECRPKAYKMPPESLRNDYKSFPEAPQE